MIELSQKAATMIDQLIAQQEDSNLFLRIGIEDGGCSGLSYLIHLDDTRNEYDHYLEHDGITVAWDSRAEQYIEGIKIDYMEQGMSDGFTIDNPNAKATCGCGASFRTATYKGTRNKCD